MISTWLIVIGGLLALAGALGLLVRIARVLFGRRTPPSSEDGRAQDGSAPDSPAGASDP